MLLRINVALKKLSLMSKINNNNNNKIAGVLSSTTESGVIVVPKQQSMTWNPDDCDDENVSIPRTALVLPFDSLIWKTVIDLIETEEFTG